MKALKVKVEGKVQRTGYRWFVVEKARELGVIGYVDLTPDGGVSIHVQGDEETVEKFLKEIRNPPPPASVKELTTTQAKPESKLKTFTIKYGTIGDELQEGFGPMQYALEDLVAEIRRLVEEFREFSKKVEEGLGKR